MVWAVGLPCLRRSVIGCRAFNAMRKGGTADNRRAFYLDLRQKIKRRFPQRREKSCVCADMCAYRSKAVESIQFSQPSTLRLRNLQAIDIGFVCSCHAAEIEPATFPARVAALIQRPTAALTSPRGAVRGDCARPRRNTCCVSDNELHGSQRTARTAVVLL